jgi:hypothetical protein
MAKKVPRSAPREGGLNLAIENEDWVAISGTPAELKHLGRLLTEFAQGEGPDFLNLDSPSPLFRAGSLGITLYRTEGRR